jgi:hypothetical protein
MKALRQIKLQVSDDSVRLLCIRSFHETGFEWQAALEFLGRTERNT